MSDTNVSRHSFDAEVSQLLQLMINSVYKNKEIFLRELVSNASDAIDRLRFEALQDETLFEGDTDFEIFVEYDEEAQTITVTDNGIGMSHEELRDGLGTIAKSGTREFLERLEESEAEEELIGQFGVGFYSVFMVADEVEVRTRRAGADPEEGVLWRSEGEGTYEVESVEKQKRGTQITLHLSDEDTDLLDGHKLREIIGKYSDHISFPIKMRKEGEDEDGYETVNRASALWTRRPNELDEDDYNEFYKHVAHDFEDPLTHMHRHVEGRLKFTMLLYVPKRRPFDLMQDQQGTSHGVKLYVKRVFIMDDAEMFLPRYMRFVRGVIDSDDLDLNVSREFLQENRVVMAMKKAVTGKVLDMLEDLSEKPEDYQVFWSEFGGIFKEGIVEDRKNRDRIAPLLRFASTKSEGANETVSLQDYVDRMPASQDKIYYLTAESYPAAKNSPHLEAFRDSDVEVLLMSDPVDEWVTNHLEDYNDIPLQSVAKGDVDPGEVAGEDEEQLDEQQEQLEPLLSAFEDELGDKVQDVRLSKRLTQSPACLVAGEEGITGNMERILKAAGREAPGFQPILELNPSHPIIERLEGETDSEDFSDWAQVIFDQALISEGGQVDDPGSYNRRLNRLITKLMGE